VKPFKQVYMCVKKQEEAVASLVIVSVMSLVFVSISIAITRTNLITFTTVENLKNSRHSYYLSESGLEDTMIQLEENLSYDGNPAGEVTPIGTYTSLVSHIGTVYTVQATGSEGKTKRTVQLSITVSYELAAVTTKATYMADTFLIRGDNARIEGDVWTNDDFNVEENAVVYGNLSAAGKGSAAVNRVWDGVIGGDPDVVGGKVIDNPETTEETEGNILGWDDVTISGSGSYVEGNVTSNDGIEVINSAVVDGVITEDAGLVWEDIPVPNYNYSTYKQQAIADGKYYATQQDFAAYLDSLDALSGGTERRLPDGLYYIENGAVKIYPGSPMYLNGSIIAEDNIYIYCEFYQTMTNNIPALVAGKDVHIESYYNQVSGSYEGSGPVRINGIVYAGKKAYLKRFRTEDDTIIDGAMWAGDDVFVEDNTFIKYNETYASDVMGFDFVTGITDLSTNSWEEVL
jgi:cytoskeletal protein CcmA (bactofilin family)